MFASEVETAPEEPEISDGLSDQDLAFAVADLVSLKIPGLGPRRARLLVRAFGGRHQEALDAGPDGLASITSIDAKTRIKIVEGWEATRAMRATIAYIANLGIPTGVASQIRTLCGVADTSLETLKNRLCANPYYIFATAGCDFKIADRVALKLGIPPDSTKRIAGGINEFLARRELAGHTRVDPYAACVGAAGLLRLKTSVVRERLWESETHGLWTVYDEEIGWTHLQRIPIAEQEQAITVSLYNRLALGQTPVQTTLSNDIRALPPDADNDRILRLLSNRVTILIGGSGTGKTSLASKIAAAAKRQDIKIAGCAPTGLAAARLSAVARINTSTIHRLIGLAKDGTPQRPKRADTYPSVLIVDEASLLSLAVATKFFEMVPKSVAIILLGDTKQLPSVECGAILNDLVLSGIIPTVELTEVRRQKNSTHHDCDSIVEAAWGILEGRRPRFGTDRDSPIRFIDVKDDRKALASILRLSKHFVEDKKLVVDDIRIIAPIRNGLLGVTELAQLLREHLNPATFTNTDPIIFRRGDRVIYTENDRQLGLSNGDLGKVVHADPDIDWYEVEFARGRHVILMGDHLENLHHALALTGHQTQGNEFENIIIPIGLNSDENTRSSMALHRNNSSEKTNSPYRFARSLLPRRRDKTDQT